MKTFRKILSEVAQPKAGDEINFKAKHEIEMFDYPSDVENQFRSKLGKTPARKADYKASEDEDVYEALDPVGQEDDDIDNDGDSDNSDKYLLNRRKAIKKAIQKEEAELDEAAYMSGSSTGRAAAHHDQAQKHFDAAENASTNIEAIAHKDAAKAHIKAGISHEKRAENPSVGPTAAAIVSNHAHKLTQKANRYNESVELEEAASFNSVLKAHKYSGTGKNYTGIGGTKVTYYGDHAVSYNEADGRKVHKTASSLNKHLNALHDHEVSLKSLKEEAELDEVTRSAIKRPIQYTDARGITRTRLTTTRPVQHDQHGQEKIRESAELDEAKSDIYHKHMLKALGKSRLPKNHQYTSAIADNGDFVVYDGGSRIAGRIGKGDHNLKEELAQLDEISKKTLGSYVKKASDDMANNAYNLGARDPLKPKGSWGKSFKRRAGIAKATERLTKESVELDETFTVGAEKLSDGSTVILKKQDADLLNNLFKDLNPANKKKMMKVAMSDKTGFNEILGFAREAL